ncbi:MAG: hypothetical protein ABSD31_15920 [Candidatus Binataceae bacterium]|jgi:hypothetical protein
MKTATDRSVNAKAMTPVASRYLFDELGPEGALEARIEDLTMWLKQNGENCQSEQRHLDDTSVEQIYWHFGYLSALTDVLKQMRRWKDRLN